MGVAAQARCARWRVLAPSQPSCPLLFPRGLPRTRVRHTPAGGPWPLAEDAHLAVGKVGSREPGLRSFQSLPWACSALGPQVVQEAGCQPGGTHRLGGSGARGSGAPAFLEEKTAAGLGHLPHSTAQSRWRSDCPSATGSQTRAVSHSDPLAPPPQGPGSGAHPPISQVGRLSSEDVPESRGARQKAGEHPTPWPPPRDSRLPVPPPRPRVRGHLGF